MRPQNVHVEVTFLRKIPPAKATSERFFRWPMQSTMRLEIPFGGEVFLADVAYEALPAVDVRHGSNKSVLGLLSWPVANDHLRYFLPRLMTVQALFEAAIEEAHLTDES